MGQEIPKAATIRAATVDDKSFIEDMLVEAANWNDSRPRRSRGRRLVSQPTLAMSAVGHAIPT